MSRRSRSIQISRWRMPDSHQRGPRFITITSRSTVGNQRRSPKLAEAHLALGQCAYWLDQDYERALAEFGAAAALSPSDAEIGRLIASIKRRQGKWQESLEEYERVQKTDPQNPNTVRELVFTNTARRRWPEASRWATQMRTMAPASLVAKIQSGYVEFCWKGDTGPLKAILGEVAAADPGGEI